MYYFSPADLIELRQAMLNAKGRLIDDPNFDHTKVAVPTDKLEALLAVAETFTPNTVEQLNDEISALQEQALQLRNNLRWRHDQLEATMLSLNELCADATALETNVTKLAEVL